MSSINFSSFRTLSPELSSSLIDKLTQSLFFNSCVGYLSKAEFVSSLSPLHTKPFLPTPRYTLLRSLTSTITNPSIIFAPLTNTTSSQLNAPPTLVLAHSVALLLPFGIFNSFWNIRFGIFNSSWYPLIANHWCLQTKRSLITHYFCFPPA